MGELTAPYGDAYRVNGNASCQTNSDMAECGYINGWLFVRYTTNNGGCRVGYIPPSYKKTNVTSHTPVFQCVPAVVNSDTYLTDNPMMQGTRFTTLYAGQTIYVLAKYTYFQNKGLDWWYVECEVEGQSTRGFIDKPSSSLSPPGSGSTNIDSYPTKANTPTPNPYNAYRPQISIWGTDYIFDVKIQGGQTGDRMIVRAQPNTNSAQVTVVYPGDRHPCYAIQRGNTGKD